MYLGLALVLLLAALWIGIALANRFVDPIRNLRAYDYTLRGQNLVTSYLLSRHENDFIAAVDSYQRQMLVMAMGL